MGDTLSYGPYGPYSNAPMLNLLIQAQRPQVPAPFNAAGVPGLAGSPSGPAVAAPIPFNWNLNSYLPGGGVGTAQSRAIGAPAISSPNYLTALNNWRNGLFTTPAQAATPGGAVMNQANPNMTAGVPGLAGGPSGAAVAPPGQPMPTPSQPSQAQRLAAQAQAYRMQTTAARQALTTAQLNDASLAAARAGRTYLQPGPYPASGNIVQNALIAPPTMTPAQLAMNQGQQLTNQGLY